MIDGMTVSAGKIALFKAFGGLDSIPIVLAADHFVPSPLDPRVGPAVAAAAGEE